MQTPVLICSWWMILKNSSLSGRTLVYIYISDHDNQTAWWEWVFSQWRPVVSLILLSLWLISVLLTTALSISMILAAVKSSFNMKLVLIHMYVLVVNVFVRACTALALSIRLYLQSSDFAIAPPQLVSLPFI